MHFCGHALGLSSISVSHSAPLCLFHDRGYASAIMLKLDDVFSKILGAVSVLVLVVIV